MEVTENDMIGGGGNPMAAIDGIAEPLAFRRACLEAQEKVLGSSAPLKAQAAR